MQTGANLVILRRPVLGLRVSPGIEHKITAAFGAPPCITGESKLKFKAEAVGYLTFPEWKKLLLEAQTKIGEGRLCAEAPSPPTMPVSTPNWDRCISVPLLLPRPPMIATMNTKANTLLPQGDKIYPDRSRWHAARSGLSRGAGAPRTTTPRGVGPQGPARTGTGVFRLRCGLAADAAVTAPGRRRGETATRNPPARLTPAHTSQSLR